MNPADDTAWQDEAVCAQTDPELFFPIKGGTAVPAKQICRSCPVRLQCLEAAMELEGANPVYHRAGIWGGLSPQQRADLARARTEGTAA